LLPGKTLDELRRVRQLLERALLEAIPDHEWFESEEEARFETFLQWLGSLTSRSSKGGLGIITTNYDMLSDLAAMYVGEVEGSPGTWSFADLANKIDFGFRWVRSDRIKEEFFSRPEHPRVCLYKLHGSTNWLRCPLCENLYIDPNGPIAWVARKGMSTAHNQCHCSETRLEAQMVSPSFVREFREPNLIATWKNALGFLRQSSRWIIMGFALFSPERLARKSAARRYRPSNSMTALD
jgi:NAD-dependent SIR2 family protein deacetylase